MLGEAEYPAVTSASRLRHDCITGPPPQGKPQC
jgi:hypothetical protein